MFSNYNQKKIEKAEMEKKEKTLQTKIESRKKLSLMKTQCNKLDAKKDEYIEKARKAMVVGNNQQLNIMKINLKRCIASQRTLEVLSSHLEIAIENNEMNQIVDEFVKGMNLITKDLVGINPTSAITKVQSSYEKALSNSNGQLEALEQFISDSEDTLKSFGYNQDSVSEDEIDALINNQAADLENDIDNEIDSKINMIKEKIKL